MPPALMILLPARKTVATLRGNPSPGAAGSKGLTSPRLPCCPQACSVAVAPGSPPVHFAHSTCPAKNGAPATLADDALLPRNVESTCSSGPDAEPRYRNACGWLTVPVVDTLASRSRHIVPDGGLRDTCP